MIQLENVNKIFNVKKNVVHAVKDVNLEIADGEIFGIIGFSGAGKSTLVRCINLLENVTTGRVIIDGEDLCAMNEKDLRNKRKKIGMIFQHFNLMRSRNVYQNIAFPLKDSGLSKVETEERIMGLLDLVDLRDKKDAYPSQLSGGQKQRVAIARSLANNPDVLLCDEATSALDPQTTKSILKLLKRVNEEMGITIVLITHEMAVVKDICHRVAVMENGCIVEEGNILDVFSHPKAEITRNFIASTSSLSHVYDLLKEHAGITELHDGQRMVKLNYDSVNTSKALISEISRDFHVDTNIIFGNVEIIQGNPLGDLVVILSGEQDQIDQAIQYLEQHDVCVEVMKSC